MLAGDGSELANFRIRTRQDKKVEGKETFRLDLSSASSGIVGSTVKTTLRDDDGSKSTSSPSSGLTPSISPFPTRLPPGTFGDNFNFGSL